MHTLDLNARRRLGRLIGTRFDQLVWDLNAVYLVQADESTKIGLTCAAVESRQTGQREEIHPLTVSAYPTTERFVEDGESGFAYWVVATDETITGIDLIRGAVRFPPWELVRPSSVPAGEPDVFVFDGGVFVHTTAGVLAAIPCAPMMYGFASESLGSGPSVSLVEAAAAKAMLPEGYDLIPLSESG
jgi:hypothetical protein